MTLPDFSKLTVKEIKEWATLNGIKPASGLSKAYLIQYVSGQYIEKEQGILKTGPQYISYDMIEPVSFNKKADWMEHLKEHGWAVVPIDGWKKIFVDRFFTWFDSCSDSFDRDDQKTWTEANLPPMSYGILKHYFGQTALQWEIRELLLPIFAKIWGVSEQELLCSFDGGCLIPSITIDVDPNVKEVFKHWFHVDQHRTDRKYSCIQGIVNFVDNGPSAGGLLLLEKSMHVFNDYMDKHPSYGLTWQVCNMNDTLLLNRKIMKVCAPAGSVILFDSRMFHANTPPVNTTDYRMCTYVSMQPRSCATPKELAKRIKIYEEGRMTNHWCCGEYFTLLPKEAYARGKPINKPSVIEIAPLTDVMKHMIGY